MIFRGCQIFPPVNHTWQWFTSPISMDWFKGHFTSERPISNGKISVFRWRLSLQPIHWLDLIRAWKKDNHKTNPYTIFRSIPLSIAIIFHQETGEKPIFHGKINGFHRRFSEKNAIFPIQNAAEIWGISGDLQDVEELWDSEVATEVPATWRRIWWGGKLADAWSMADNIYIYNHIWL